MKCQWCPLKDKEVLCEGEHCDRICFGVKSGDEKYIKMVYEIVERKSREKKEKGGQEGDEAQTSLPLPNLTPRPEIEETVFADPRPSTGPVPLPDYQPPPWYQQAASFVTSAAQFMAGGFMLATPEEQAYRMGICRGCEWFDAEKVKCNKCGCDLAIKTTWTSERCPLEPPKWGAIQRAAQGPPGAGCGGCGG